MAKGRHYSSYQQGIIRRYYENRDTLASQRLGEIVSELYLAQGDPKKSERLWKRAAQALRNTQAAEAWVEPILAKRDLKKLAEVVGEISFREDPGSGSRGGAGSSRHGGSPGNGGFQGKPGFRGRSGSRGGA